MPTKYKLILAASVFAWLVLLSDSPRASVSQQREASSTSNGDYRVYVKGIT